MVEFVIAVRTGAVSEPLTVVKYDLEIYAPIDAGGHYNESVEMFAGLKVWDANPKVEAALKERGHL